MSSSAPSYQTLISLKKRPQNTLLILGIIFSSPEPACSQGWLIVYPCSGIRHQPFSKIFSEKSRSINAKFHVELLWEWGTEVSINGPGHITILVLTLTYFTARSHLVACVFEWGKLLHNHLMGKSCSKYDCLLVGESQGSSQVLPGNTL